MDIQFYGANCLVLTTKQGRIVIDDNLVDLGAKSVDKAGDISLFTSAHALPTAPSKIIIDGPGEYEVSGISIHGIAARAHMDEDNKKTATMYKIVADDVRILVTGHIYPELSDDQLEAIGMVDAMIIPIGSNGYTLDSIGALKVAKKVEPKLILPTHYADKGLTYPMTQQTLEDGLKGLGMEPKETVSKLKLKAGDFAETMQLIVLERA